MLGARGGEGRVKGEMINRKSMGRCFFQGYKTNKGAHQLSGSQREGKESLPFLPTIQRGGTYGGVGDNEWRKPTALRKKRKSSAKHKKEKREKMEKNKNFFNLKQREADSIGGIGENRKKRG